MKRLVLTLALVAGACGLVGCGGNTPSPRTVLNATCSGARTVCRVVDRVCPAPEE